MKLVMDLVVNHTSDEHPWFVESRSSQRQPEARLVLVARRGAAPNELALVLLRLGLGARRGTGEYYLHLFSRKQPDLNWENPEVRAAIYAMMRWWLDRGVDGFRMDVINMISKDLPDGTSDGARRRLTLSAARGSTSSCRRCTARCSPAATASSSPWARCRA